MQHLVKKTKEKNIATFYWMGLSDGAYRSQPAFNQPDVAEAIVRAYHGNTDSFKYPTIESEGGSMTCFEGEKALGWGNGINISNTSFAAFDKTVQAVLSYTVTANSGADIQLYYGDWSDKLTFIIDGKTYNADYNPSGGNGTSHTTTITFNESTFNKLTQKGLIIHGDGITMSKVVLQSGTAGITSIVAPHSADNRIYNLNGQQVTNPRQGIFVQNGKKFLIKRR